MLPLSGNSSPNNHRELRDAIEAGFAAHGVSARNVLVEGGAFPNVEQLSVDLTGAQITRDVRISPPERFSDDSITAENFNVTGDPLVLENMPARLSLSGSKVELTKAVARGGEPLLALKHAEHGDLSIELQRAELEKLVHALANEAAGKHGVAIKETRIEITSKSPREVSVRADVTAKAFLFTAPVTISGDLKVDDALNLHISNLAVSGSGMAASMAGGFLRPQFDRIQNQPISLSVLALGDVKLRDIRLEGGETIRLRAEFGS